MGNLILVNFDLKLNHEVHWRSDSDIWNPEQWYIQVYTSIYKYNPFRTMLWYENLIKSIY